MSAQLNFLRYLRPKLQEGILIEISIFCRKGYCSFRICWAPLLFLGCAPGLADCELYFFLFLNFFCVLLAAITWHCLVVPVSLPQRGVCLTTLAVFMWSKILFSQNLADSDK